MRYVKRYEELDFKKIFGKKSNIWKKGDTEKEVPKTIEKKPKPEEEDPHKDTLFRTNPEKYLEGLIKESLEKFNITELSTNVGDFEISYKISNSVIESLKKFEIDNSIINIKYNISNITKFSFKVQIRFVILIEFKDRITDKDKSIENNYGAYSVWLSNKVLTIGSRNYDPLRWITLSNNPKDKGEVFNVLNIKNALLDKLEGIDKSIDNYRKKEIFYKDFKETTLEIKELLYDIKDFCDESDYQIINNRFVCFFRFKTGIKQSRRSSQIQLTPEVSTIFTFLTNVKESIKSIDKEIQIDVEFTPQDVIIIFTKHSSLFNAENHGSPYHKWQDNTVTPFYFGESSYDEEVDEDGNYYEEEG